MNFKKQELNQINQDILSKSGGWNKLSPIPMSRLNLLDLYHVDFELKIKKGQLLCLDVVADSVINIFKELLEAEFPIKSIELLDQYNYNDFDSMTANNTSCYNSRLIPGTDKLSIHSYGLAIDVNPEQNPMISFCAENNHHYEAQIYPANGKNYCNRMLLKPGMIEPVVDIFFRNGFNVWGGLWNSLLDYHHFEVDRNFAHKLATSPKDEAYDLWLNHLQSCN